MGGTGSPKGQADSAPLDQHVQAPKATSYRWRRRVPRKRLILPIEREPLKPEIITSLKRSLAAMPARNRAAIRAELLTCRGISIDRVAAITKAVHEDMPEPEAIAPLAAEGRSWIVADFQKELGKIPAHYQLRWVGDF